MSRVRLHFHTSVMPLSSTGKAESPSPNSNTKQQMKGFSSGDAGENEDQIKRWAAHMEKRTPDSLTDWGNAFTECQKKIVAMFHEDPLGFRNAPEKDPPPMNTEEDPPPVNTEQAAEPVHGNVNMSEPPKEEEEVVEDPVEKEKVIEGARALLTHAHTEVIIKELGITKEKIHGEAQRLHGDSELWTIEIWAKYTEAIAHFHLRKGTLYDNLKPEYTDKKKGPF